MMTSLELQPWEMLTGAIWPRYTILCDHGGATWIVSPEQANEFIIPLLVQWLRFSTHCECGDDIIERYNPGDERRAAGRRGR